MATCGACGGSGGKWQSYNKENGMIGQRWIPCGACSGSGQR